MTKIAHNFHKPKNGNVKYNVHAHVIFLNYDFDKSKTVLRSLYKKDWANMQDVAQKSFNTHNLDFIRGVPKEETKKEHLERNDYILQEQQQDINNQILTFKKNKNDLDKQIKIIMSP